MKIYLDYIEKRIAEIDEKLSGRQLPKNRYMYNGKKKELEAMKDFIIKHPVTQLPEEQQLIIKEALQNNEKKIQ